MYEGKMVIGRGMLRMELPGKRTVVEVKEEDAADRMLTSPWWAFSYLVGVKR